MMSEYYNASGVQSSPIDLIMGRKILACIDAAFFFLRLPNGQYGPVSQLSSPEKSNEAVQVHLIGAEPIVQVRT